MDNNLNESGIPNVSDIKFDDTPAQSFDNLYGNAAPAAPSVAPVQSAPVAPSVEPVQPAPVAPSVAPAEPSPVAPSVAPVEPAPVAPSVAPVEPAPVAPSVAPVEPAPVAPSVAPVEPAPVAPSVAPVEPAPVAPSVAPVEPVPVAPSVAPVEPAPVAPNPGTIMQPQADLSNVSIDADKMQSIEEQLSKTSQYNPEDIQKEMISISSDNKSDKSKSGLAFVIVLFIILAAVIAFLPYITKLIG